MAWDPSLNPEVILQDWTRLTFGTDREVLNTITSMSMQSWPAYENYTGNLGIQTLTDILYTHFGPNPASQDNNGWGQWTRANNHSLGMDRTVRNGTGNAGQYPPEIAAMYENIETTPDELLLWFHHVPYTQRLKKTNKTVIQHFYDAHYDGAAAAHGFLQQWESLKGKVDEQRYQEVLFRQEFQAGHAVVWRDFINSFYCDLSGIRDEKGRVCTGEYNFKHRVELENAELRGYKRYGVDPFHAASNRTGIVTASNSTAGQVSFRATFPAGTYDLAINYFDMEGGRSSYEVRVDNKTVGTWQGDLEDRLGRATSVYLDGHSAARVLFRDVSVRNGSEVVIIGKPDGIEPAPLDYVSFLKPETWD
jgi:alpha-glucuronidase